MNLLITGGAGFIGSNFVLWMLSRHPSYRLVNLDKLTYAGNLENLREAEGNPNHVFIRADICDRKAVDNAIRTHRVEAIVNMAAESHVDRSIAGAAEFIETNIGGTAVLLDAAREHGIKRFVQVSTDEVYGSLGPEGAFTEQTPLHPNSPYAASKASADLLALAYHHTHGLPVVITRCSNNYGPFQFPEKLIPLMIANALQNKPLPVYGDGKNVRDWLHVRDHCSALDVALHRGKAGEVYNVGGSNERPNLEVVRLLLGELDKPESLITFVRDRPGHDRRYAIDSSKIRAELGWQPSVAFEEGMRSTVRWYLDNREWWERIVSGEYRDYYRKMYEGR